MPKNNLFSVKRSTIHNRGIYARQPIAEDTAIIQYLGKKITRNQADKRAYINGEERIYFFELNQRFVLDGDIKNNPAKYINHSCEPNCYPLINKGEIWIYALRDIAKGEELTYDYGFHRLDWHQRPCHCDSENCFGFITAREHWSGIRKTKRYQRLIATNVSL